MEATALICDEQQQFSLQAVTLPDPRPDQVAIRTAYSGVSIGTEFALIRNKISWGPYPICTGYMGTGVVTAVGSAVTSLQVGDEVYFRANDAMSLAGGQAVSCVCGTHCSHIVTNPDTTHGAARVTPGASLDTACSFVMPAVGLYGVDMAGPGLGDKVAVYGCGLIGLGVIAALVHRGCEVIAIDVNDRALALAGEMGADHLVNGSATDVPAAVELLAPGGADVVFECTGIPACIDRAIELCRVQGKFVWQGNYGEKPVSLHFLTPHGKRLRMFFPCDDGLQPCRRAVVRNMAMGALKWEKTITHRISWREAPAMFAGINAGTSDAIGVTVDWRDA